MIIQRKELLAALDSCAAGLGTKGGMNQSQCYVFRNGKVHTLNEMIYTRTDSPFNPDVPVAVPAKAFRDTLAKFGDDEINIEEKDGKIKVWVKSKRATINGHTDVYLPLEEVPEPMDWVDAPPELSDALPAACDCTGKNEDVMDNLYIGAKGIIACDRAQAIQFSIATGVRETCLIGAEGVKAIASLGIAAVSDGGNWLHYKSYTGLVASIRKCTGDYPNVIQVFQQPVISELEFPFSATDAFERLIPFLSDTTDGKTCTFSLSPGSLVLRAKNVVGMFEEKVELEYDGTEITFSASPKLLASAIRHGLPLNITDSSIRVLGSGFRYAVSITKGK
jgi:hypothetical protein